MKSLRILYTLALTPLAFGAAKIEPQSKMDVVSDRVIMDLILDPRPEGTDLGKGKFHLSDAQTGKVFEIAEDPAFSAGTIRLTLAASERVSPGDQVLVTVDPILIEGKLEKVTSFLYTVKDPEKGSDAKAFKKADGKDDSQFYFDGEISHARKQDVVGTYDLKLEFLKRANKLNTVVRYGPVFTLSGGSDPKGDPDSMRLGYTFNLPLITTQSPSVFLQLMWENTPQIESTRDFTYTNFVYSSQFKMISRAWTLAPGTRFYFRPVAGIEVGKNLASEVAAAKDQAILRPLAGSTLTLVVGLGGDKSVNLTGDYIRRWPINNEVLLSTAEDGSVQTAMVGTKPRDHIKAGFGVDFTKWAGVKIGYERGSLPAAFKFVDNKLTLSLVIKAKY